MNRRTKLLLSAAGIACGLVLVLGVAIDRFWPGRPVRRSSDPGVPVEASPLAGLNTEWDDYNAAPSAPRPGVTNFTWSTNRGSHGEQFDIWRASGVFQRDGTFSVLDEPVVDRRVSSPANEFGPYPLRRDGAWRTDPESPGSGGLVFASDRAGGLGGLDLYVLDERGEILPFGLNSAANDAYFTWLGSHAYFASDRGGDGYDIHEVAKPASVLAGRGLLIENGGRVADLSSAADDTAPWLFELAGPGGSVPETWIVFASNRPGGVGGYDLWCSRFRDGRWVAPINLGPSVNSAEDEFRPSVILLARSIPTLFFSSNRPDGKGGFDLYGMVFPSPFR